MNSISKLAVLLMISISISACGGNKKAASKNNTADSKAVIADVGDITRPPVVEKDTAPQEQANEAGETISFDEWRKRRLADQQKDQ